MDAARVIRRDESHSIRMAAGDAQNDPGVAKEKPVVV
jgi:hypothetical protein